MRQYQQIITNPGGSSLIQVVPSCWIMNGSSLIVRDGQVAFFSCNGIVSEPYPPGRHSINTGESPFFVRLRNFMTGGNPALECSVFYVATEIETTWQMGTGEILFKDQIHGLSMRAKAGCSIRFSISNARRLLKKLVGMYRDQFNEDDIEHAMQMVILPGIKDGLSSYLSTNNLYSLNANLRDINSFMIGELAETLEDFGISLKGFAFTGINIPTEDLDRIRKLEDTVAQGKANTEVEKQHMDTIYGSLNQRTMTEVLTGIPRRPNDALVTNGQQVNNQNIAQAFASLPLQIALMQQYVETMREPMNEFFRRTGSRDRSATTSRTAEGHNNEPPSLPTDGE